MRNDLNANQGRPWRAIAVALVPAVLCVSLSVATPAWAQRASTTVVPGAGEVRKPVQEPASKQHEADPAKSQAAAEADFQTWLDGVRREAAAKGISAATLHRALDKVHLVRRVVQLDRRQPEFTQTFWDYLDKRVTPARIARGQQLLAQHQALLDSVQRRYGVPARYLVAFWALETNFGDYVGRFPVIDAVATLAYDQRRSQFFRTQLLDALRIIDAGHITPQEMKGSWAGAMGQLQFIPSTFMRYAVDGDGDGRLDLWTDLADVFASGANYLSHVGWQREQRWGRAVHLPKAFDWRLVGLQDRRSLKDWAARGVRRADGGPLPQDTSVQAALVLPQGHKGPAFLVYNNFRTILHWNRSVNYALAVGILADRLVGVPPLRLGRDVDNRALSRSQSIELQRRLLALGYAAGHPDGIIGSRTRAAVRAYQIATGLPADGYPSPDVLEHLRRSTPTKAH